MEIAFKKLKIILFTYIATFFFFAWFLAQPRKRIAKKGVLTDVLLFLQIIKNIYVEIIAQVN